MEIIQSQPAQDGQPRGYVPKLYSIRLPPKLSQRFRSFAVTSEKSFAECFRAAVESYLNQRGG